jgi:hypothetical protein
MVQVLHGCARTTEAVRPDRARSVPLQRREQSMTTLVLRHGVNRKTIAKWKKRSFVHVAAMGPKQPHSTSLTTEEEATVVAFREHTLLPLGDCLGPVPVQHALQASIPHLTRSSLHRCLQRHGISRLPELKLPELKGEAEPKKRFKKYQDRGRSASAASTSTSPRCTPRRARG